MRLTINEAFSLIGATWAAQLKANSKLTRFGLRGPPGIGKTKNAGAISVAMYSTPAVFFEAGHGAEEEIAGIPVRDSASGAVLRLPLGPLRLACEAPRALVFDEVSRANQSKQGALLTLANEGRAGDFVLHPKSPMIFAWNEAGAEGSDGAHEIIPALLNRLCVIDVYSTFEESSDVIMNRMFDPASSAAALAADYVFTAQRMRELIQPDPPPGSTIWASPRAVTEGLGSLDAAMQGGVTDTKLLTAVLAGHIGDEVAASYFAMRSIRDQLPTDEEIAKDPKGARLPVDLKAGVAVMGLVGAASKRSPDAAWVYTNRMDASRLGEIRGALSASLVLAGVAHTTPDAQRAWASLLSQSGGARSKLSQTV